MRWIMRAFGEGRWLDIQVESGTTKVRSNGRPQSGRSNSLERGGLARECERGQKRFVRQRMVERLRLPRLGKKAYNWQGDQNMWRFESVSRSNDAW